MRKTSWITKIILLFLAFLLVRSIFYDLSEGTASKLAVTTTKEDVPAATTPTSEEDENSSSNEDNTSETDNQRYETVPYVVKAGDTVLSIAENLNERAVPINTLLEDFVTLNPGVDPHEIHIDKTYYFPVYRKDFEQ